MKIMFIGLLVTGHLTEKPTCGQVMSLYLRLILHTLHSMLSLLWLHRHINIVIGKIYAYTHEYDQLPLCY